MKIKGHTTIELFDAKTGKLVQRTDDDNMLTKALFYFYNQGGMSNPSAFNAAALRSDALHYLLGGVLCLDTALTESDEVIRVPKGVEMIANGAYNVLNGGNPPELGSWSELESGWQQDGSYKMVWNYTTAQGNGTIACVCLSSLYGGFSGIGNKSGTWKVEGAPALGSYNSYYEKRISDGQVVGYYNNLVTIFPSSFAGLTSITVNKYKMPFTQLDIRDILADGTEKDSISINLPASLQNLSGIWEVNRVFQSGKYAYILIAARLNYSYPTINNTVYAVKYDLQYDTFLSVTPVTLTLAEGENLQCSGITDKWIILGKHAVEIENLANIIDLDDLSQVIPTTFGSGFLALEGIESDILWGVFDGLSMRIDMTKEKIYPCNATDYLNSVGDVAELLRLSARRGNSSNPVTNIYRDPRYIATINNLDAPITKDASKTMKVTYVLRFPN